MSQQFLGEIKIISWGFAPKGWAFCNGQMLPINQNQALFSLLGTTYGGNGQTTFALPDLQGKVPIHIGNGHALGEPGGAVTNTLSQQSTPPHIHALVGTNAGADATKAGSAGMAKVTNDNIYAPAGTASQILDNNAMTDTGGSQPHNNVMPTTVLNMIIALVGIFPSRN